MNNKSISQLEGWSWNQPIPDEDNSSYEEYNFYVLHKKPVNEYTPEDLGFMITQESGLKYVLPLAIGILKSNPFVSANYPGGLLTSVLGLPKTIWEQSPHLYNEVKIIFDNAKNNLENVEELKGSYRTIKYIRSVFIIFQNNIVISK
ncbi:hypothetical protein E5K00_10395 [Hymenobacter aquaticus]|uniref:Uncharacterized protein n=1 Tax=Hymenobacter aquaticus TaxID=1867101 RepID=A0A4Z0Q912_9BACT|nr:contact-dependent growth inhibition system immunity protein [Hymenobacter aquaticus]TGE25571.1 hypothetical protein E5K00_10395 [Hymenobacter aquaticus]